MAKETDHDCGACEGLGNTSGGYECTYCDGTGKSDVLSPEEQDALPATDEVE